MKDAKGHGSNPRNGGKLSAKQENGAWSIYNEHGQRVLRGMAATNADDALDYAETVRGRHPEWFGDMSDTERGTLAHGVSDRQAAALAQDHPKSRVVPVNYKGASIEQERDGSFSVYRTGDPYATTGGFKTIEAAKKAIDG